MNYSYVYLVLSAVCAAVGQIVLKIGSHGKSDVMSLFNAVNLIGCFCYGAGLLLWMLGLSKLPLSTAYAFTALTFVLVYVFGHVYLGEVIAPLAVVGVLLVVTGMLLIAWTQAH